jgi:hypothetical protein
MPTFRTSDGVNLSYTDEGDGHAFTTYCCSSCGRSERHLTDE